MKRAYLYLPFLLLLIAAACPQIEPPKSFDERLAYGYASVAASRGTATKLLEGKRISVDDAKQVQALADQARTSLDIARGLKAKDLKSADAQLGLALSVLTRVEAFLKEKQ